MFTGIIEETGAVETIERQPKSILLGVRARTTARASKVGDSVAVNGCCLTVTRISRSLRGEKTLSFDLLRETWLRTNFQFLRPGALVNLERPLRADGRFDGHFVTGHIDGIGGVRRWERVGDDYVLEIAAPPAVMRYIVAKGSVAVDGISLTVAESGKKDFRAWIIPHTYHATNLRARKAGDAVNLEADLLGKYVERFLNKAREKSGAVNRT